MKLALTCLSFIIVISTGCVEQEYASCDAPDDELQIMFKPKNSAHPFSHSFCIVCNPALEPSEYGDWALEMGAPQAPENTDGLLPCLYAYSEIPHTNGPDTLEGCKAQICEGRARYNDMVNQDNGNFDLSPILD